MGPPPRAAAVGPPPRAAVVGPPPGAAAENGRRSPKCGRPGPSPGGSGRSRRSPNAVVGPTLLFFEQRGSHDTVAAALRAPSYTAAPRPAAPRPAPAAPAAVGASRPRRLTPTPPPAPHAYAAPGASRPRRRRVTPTPAAARGPSGRPRRAAKMGDMTWDSFVPVREFSGISGTMKRPRPVSSRWLRETTCLVRTKSYDGPVPTKRSMNRKDQSHGAARARAALGTA